MSKRNVMFAGLAILIAGGLVFSQTNVVKRIKSHVKRCNLPIAKKVPAKLPKDWEILEPVDYKKGNKSNKKQFPTSKRSSTKKSPLSFPGITVPLPKRELKSKPAIPTITTTKTDKAPMPLIDLTSPESQQIREEKIRKERERLIKEGYLNPDGSYKYIPGELVIQFKNDARKKIHISTTKAGVPAVGISTIDALNKQYNAQEIKRVVKEEEIANSKTALKHGIDLIYLSNFPKDKDMEKIAEEYRKDPNVKAVTPNYKLIPCDVPQKTEPTDPKYTWEVENMHLREAWYVTTGHPNLRLCHMAWDSKPDVGHSDLNAHWSGLSNDPGTAAGIDNHPTGCCGNMVAENNNGAHTTSPAGGWGAGNPGCQFAWTANSGIADLITNLAWVVSHCCQNSSDSIVATNCSYWFGNDDASPIRASVNDAWDNGVVQFCSAGNNGPDLNSMAIFENVIAVGGHSNNDVNEFNIGDWVDISAPSTGIYCLGYDGTAGGTSFGSPLSCGVVGLMKTEHRNWTQDSLKTYLEQSTDWRYNYTPGSRLLLGHGIVNAYEALKIYNYNVSVNFVADVDTNPPAEKPITPWAVVQNRGKYFETFPVFCQVDTITGTTIYKDTVLIEGLPDRSDQVLKGIWVKFNDWTPGGEGAQYKMYVYTALSTDQNAENDTVTVNITVGGGGEAGTAWLSRNDLDEPNATCTGYAANDFSTLVPAPVAACSIIGARVWVNNPNSDVCTLWVGPDDASHANRYAPVEPWPDPMGNMWFEEVFTPNDNTWTEVNFSSPYWMATPEPFHVAIYTPTANVEVRGTYDSGNPDYGKDATGIYSRNNDPHSGWDWSYIFGDNPPYFIFALQAKVKYMCSDDDVAADAMYVPDGHEICTVPIIPSAKVKNAGNKTYSFDVTMRIDSLGNQAYISTKTSDVLAFSDTQTIVFDPWVPAWDGGTYVARVYTQLVGDQDNSNDTIMDSVVVNFEDTLYWDDGEAHGSLWDYDVYCDWAVRFTPSMPCSVRGVYWPMYAHGSGDPYTCNVYIWEDTPADTPGTALASGTEGVGGGYSWYAHTFLTANQVPRPNAEPFFVGIGFTGKYDATDTTICEKDASYEFPYMTYTKPSGEGWDGPYNPDWLIRAIIKYYASGTPEHDVSAYSVDNPPPYSWEYPNRPIELKATLKNIGRNAETFNVKFEARDSLGALEWSTTKYSVNLSIAEEKQITFDEKWAPQVVDMDYTCKVFTQLGGDGNAKNDTAKADVVCAAIDVLSYIRAVDFGGIGGDEFTAMKFIPERPCTVWGAMLGLVCYHNPDTAKPCTLFLWEDTLGRPRSKVNVDYEVFEPHELGVDTCEYWFYNLRLDFDQPVGKESAFETDKNFWIGMYTPYKNGDSIQMMWTDYTIIHYDASYGWYTDEMQLSNNRVNTAGSRSADTAWTPPDGYWTINDGADSVVGRLFIKALVKYLSYIGDPPIAPYAFGEAGAKAMNVKLWWHPVETDVSDNPITCDHYVIYRNTTPDYVPGLNTLVEGIPDTEYTNTGLDELTDYYYLICAYNKWGTRSEASRMSFKEYYANIENGSGPGWGWNLLSVPYYSYPSGLGELAQAVPACSLLVSGNYEATVYDKVFSEWIGNTPVGDGKAYWAKVNADGTMNFYGSHKTDINFDFPAGEITWFSLPYNYDATALPNGMALADSIFRTGGRTPVQDDTLFKYKQDTQDYGCVYRNFLGALVYDSWTGVLTKGDAYGVKPKTTVVSNWKPLIYSNESAGKALAVTPLNKWEPIVFKQRPKFNAPKTAITHSDKGGALPKGPTPKFKPHIMKGYVNSQGTAYLADSILTNIKNLNFETYLKDSVANAISTATTNDTIIQHSSQDTALWQCEINDLDWAVDDSIITIVTFSYGDSSQINKGYYRALRTTITSEDVQVCATGDFIEIPSIITTEDHGNYNTVIWNKASSPIMGYRIYRSVNFADIDSFKPLAHALGGINDTTHDDSDGTGLAEGDSVYYAITVVVDTYTVAKATGYRPDPSDPPLGGGSPKTPGPLGVEQQPPELPRVFALRQNMPNPFANNTVIPYDIPAKVGQETNVQIKVYDVAGKLVTTLVNGNKTPGSYSVTWNGRDNYGKRLSSGIYFYRITTAEFKKTKKLILLR